MDRLTTLPAPQPPTATNTPPTALVIVCGLVISALAFVLPGVAVYLCFGVALLFAWLYLCWRFPFPALCCVAVLGMCQGLIKQVFNWTPATYVGLDIPWVLFLAVWLVRRVKARHNTTFGIVDLLLVIFFAWSALETFNPNLPSPFMAIGALRNRLLPMLFFWVGKDLLNPQRSHRLLLVCLLVAGAGGILGLYEWTLGSAGVAKLGPGFVPRTSTDWQDAAGQGHLRPLSIYQDGGMAALFTALMACLALNTWDTYSRRVKVWVVASGLLCVAFVAVSGVRAAVLCGGAGLLITALMDPKKYLRPVALIAVVTVMVTMSGASEMGDRYKTIANPLAAYRQNRGHTLDAASHTLQEAPLGIGTGSATTSASMYVELLAPGTKVGTYQSDNAFAVLLAEGGFFLTLLYIFLLGAILYTAWQERIPRGKSPLLAPVLVVYCILLLTFSFTLLVIDWQPANILFWVLAGSLVAGKAAGYQKIEAVARQADRTPLGR